MSKPASMRDSRHPLQDEPARLEQILRVMSLRIHKVLGWSPGPAPGLGSSAGDARGERALVGTGIGAEDILVEAFANLLRYPPSRLRTSWEALSVTIADRRAKDALRKANKGLGETAERSRLWLVSCDQPSSARLDDARTQPSILDEYRDDGCDPEAEFVELVAIDELLDLARELLDEREEYVFFHLQCDGKSCVELGKEFGLTPQRIGQIYAKASETLRSHPKYPYPEDEPPKGEHDEHGP